MPHSVLLLFLNNDYCSLLAVTMVVSTSASDWLK